MLAPVIHIAPIAMIHRERILPCPGRVAVRKGQKVDPNDVIAEANLAPEHLMIDVARALKVPAEKAGRYLQYKEGEEVAEGDVLAARSAGLAHLIVRAPKDGKIVAFRKGQLLFSLETRPFELKAGLAGVVTDVVADLGAYIEATGALVQGVWGNGKIDFGLLNVQMTEADDVITPQRVDVSMRGTIVLGGYCDNKDVLTAAAEIPLKGLILASMSSALVTQALKMPYPIILLEGFGRLPLNAVAYKLLSTSSRREAVINAETNERMLRPEVVIPLPAPSELPPHSDMGMFKAGQKVRIVRAPYMGQVGTLTGIRPTPVVLANGLRTRAAEVRFDSGENATLPLANLEILE